MGAISEGFKRIELGFLVLEVAAKGVNRIITGGGRNQIQLQASNGGNLYATNGEADLLLIDGFDPAKDQIAFTTAIVMNS